MGEQGSRAGEKARGIVSRNEAKSLIGRLRSEGTNASVEKFAGVVVKGNTVVITGNKGSKIRVNAGSGVVGAGGESRKGGGFFNPLASTRRGSAVFVSDQGGRVFPGGPGSSSGPKFIEVSTAQKAQVIKALQSAGAKVSQPRRRTKKK
jgi:hypothetical protein